MSHSPTSVAANVEPERLEQPADDAVVAEDRTPDERLHEVARPQRCEHGDDEDVRVRGETSRAMEYAIGNASTAQATVTSEAILIVRQATSR